MVQNDPVDVNALQQILDATIGHRDRAQAASGAAKGSHAAADAIKASEFNAAVTLVETKRAATLEAKNRCATALSTAQQYRETSE